MLKNILKIMSLSICLMLLISATGEAKSLQIVDIKASAKTMNKNTVVIDNKIKNLPSKVLAEKKSETNTIKQANNKSFKYKWIDRQKINDEIPHIKVFINNVGNNLTINSPNNFKIISHKYKQDILVPAGNNLYFNLKNGEINLDNKSLGTNVKILNHQNGTIKVGNETFRGNIDIKITNSNNMQVVNDINLEEYLYGVVPVEISPSWPQAAIEAQAVAARTYALYSMKNPRSLNYDVERDTRSQVYEGVRFESTATNKAINATKGIIMTYNNQPIDALFHADAGGYTANSEDVWGNKIPYLRAVAEINRDRSRNGFTWQMSLKRQQIENILRQAGKDVGQLKNVRIISSFTDKNHPVRVSSVEFIGTKNNYNIPASKVQSLFGFKTTVFNIKATEPPKMIIFNNKTKNNKSNSANIQNKTKVETVAKNNLPDTFIVQGSGYGHGLGLSQWGAHDMAKAAKIYTPDYYKKILEHYYKNIKFTKLY